MLACFGHDASSYWQMRMHAFLKDLVDPLTISFLLLACGLFRLWWKYPDARKSLRWFLAGYVVAWLSCTNAVAFLAAGSFEWQYPPVVEMPSDAEAIVALSGGVHASGDLLPESWPNDGTLRRCMMAARLYHDRRCPVIVCGGQFDDAHPGETLAGVMRQTLLDMGVDDGDIYLEDASVDTFENAAGARETLEERGLGRVVLITDGTHLFRSVRCFESQGVDVIPVGAKYMASSFKGRVSDFIPRSEGAHTNRIVVYEALGLLLYKIRGRI
jgi:uncharacterized SAM-binding protein YcdF (DUF218 family)